MRQKQGLGQGKPEMKLYPTSPLTHGWGHLLFSLERSSDRFLSSAAIRHLRVITFYAALRTLPEQQEW